MDDPNELPPLPIIDTQNLPGLDLPAYPSTIPSVLENGIKSAGSILDAISRVLQGDTSPLNPLVTPLVTPAIDQVLNDKIKQYGPMLIIGIIVLIFFFRK
jgi:hypothetical protein